MNLSTKLKVLFATTVAAIGITAMAANVEITSMDRLPGSGKATINYKVSGLSAKTDLTITASAGGKSAAKTVVGVANGNGTATIDYQSVLGTAPNVAFSAALTDPDTEGVQLWDGGPYWATCNVGASRPEDYGYYFWWGDTIGYRYLNSQWEAVKSSAIRSFSTEGTPTWNKSVSTLTSNGYLDSTGNLASSHDAATAYLGAPWRMPTKAEIEAIVANCTATWTTQNGVNGQLVKGKGVHATKSIFLPVGGYADQNGRSFADSLGDYWSSTPVTDNPVASHFLQVNNSNPQFRTTSSTRSLGFMVRPVRVVAK